MSKTNFSFELQYVAPALSQGKSDEVMLALESSLLEFLRPIDDRASVTVSNSHKGNANKLLEITCTASDVQIADILTRFCEQQGVKVNAME